MGDFLFFLGYVLFVGALFGIFTVFAISRQAEERSDDSFEFEQLREQLFTLLISGLHWGLATIRKERFDGVIQFRKYIRTKGDYGIELGLPVGANRLRDHAGALRDWCAETGTEFRVATESHEQPVEVVYVDCGRDIDKAMVVLKAVASRVFGWPLQGRYSCDLNRARAGQWVVTVPAGGYPSGDELLALQAGALEDPDGARARCAWIRRQRLFARQCRDLGEGTIRDGCVLALFQGLAALGGLALIYGLLVRWLDPVLLLGLEWTAYPLDMFGLSASVKLYDAVCIALFLVPTSLGMTKASWRWRANLAAAKLKAGLPHRLLVWLVRTALRAAILIAVISWFVV